MNHLKKEQIVNCLFEYCDRYESHSKAAKSLKEVSSAIISQMLNDNWDLISDKMWRNVATQIGYKENKWELVETSDHRILKHFLQDAKDNSLVLAITGQAGTGKTFTVKHFQASTKNVYALSCAEFWNKKQFMSEVLISMGKDYKGLGIGEMVHEVVYELKTKENPLLIFDEADKLIDAVLYFFITLCNQLEDECGIILCATNHLQKRLKRGLTLNKKGYQEIWSRIGRKCIELKGVSAADIVAICAANGVTNQKDVQEIISDSESDLRRVKRKIHAVKSKYEPVPAIGDYAIIKE